MAIRSQSAPPKRQGNWQNKVLARVVLEALGYNPSRHLPAIKAPIFFRLASKDHLCPPEILHGLLKKGHVPEVSVEYTLFQACYDVGLGKYVWYLLAGAAAHCWQCVGSMPLHGLASRYCHLEMLCEQGLCLAITV